ncbi:MAG: MBL fold metallo-hydrolase [Candidatus Korarchaeota archaeon]|nr:MBL fold metallo-hydrolase [Candidatus Korarchaeota archaeon]NIU85541.1 MBL fold metallo-hydrolase [Candidatus Thorarchaeota archaeon]NIW15652.1 MBL fold metallo-hydrolase [Candidatus Thorarchaeota archaeon]NIW53582.1 MBL fold metallo-hydrolase [Candidatus Korarchaeota archaeon]
MEKITFQLVWFDSLGAKSTATFVKTPDVSILIDPGAAAMQPSFPASPIRKGWWKFKATRAIKKASRAADVIILTHYHYDHYFPNALDVYHGKTILAKSPNKYINDSQRERAREFYANLCRRFGEGNLNEQMMETEAKEYPDPLENLPLAREKDFGDYQERREELLEKWRKRFERRVEHWHELFRITPLDLREGAVKFGDGKVFQFGDTIVRFTRPLFHGIEYSRLGWVISPIISYDNEKLIHSSDLNGVYVEDYAQWLWNEGPDVLLLDGPPKYLLGYLLNTINLQRCVNNTCNILKRTKNLELMIYDHHLLRAKKYRQRTKRVCETGEEEDIRVTTAAEYKEKTPVIGQC